MKTFSDLIAEITPVLKEEDLSKHTDSQLIKNLKKHRDKNPEKYNAHVNEIEKRGIKESFVDVFLDESTNEYFYYELNEETLEERRIKIRVTSKGNKIRRIKCPPGRIVKNVNGRQTCVTPTGRQKMKKKISVRKAVRTKKAKGAGYKRKTNFKRQRAVRKRKQMGIRNGQ